MKVLSTTLAMGAVGMLCTSTSFAGPIALTDGVAHTENFDTILNTGSTGGGSIPIDQEITFAAFTGGLTGWWNGAGTSYATATDGVIGGANSNRLISYGQDTVAERALGLGWRDLSGVNRSIGAQFQNTTGGVITQLDVSYDGEFWYHGGINAVGDLTFEYSTNATSVLDGAATWTSVASLNFTPPGQGIAPQFTGRDGNAAANRVAGISDTIAGLSIADNATFFLRWSNSHTHGMGIDNVSVTGSTIPEPASLALLGLGSVALLSGRRKA